MANGRNGTLYIGVTNDIRNWAYQHKSRIIKGFTSRYKVNRLVYFEEINSAEAAILKEKQLLKWNRAWKLALIEKDTPDWNDL